MKDYFTVRITCRQSFKRVSKHGVEWTRKSEIRKKAEFLPVISASAVPHSRVCRGLLRGSSCESGEVKVRCRCRCIRERERREGAWPLQPCANQTGFQSAPGTGKDLTFHLQTVVGPRQWYSRWTSARNAEKPRA